ncbi:hypothetical protein [Nostoc sp.]|uniref:hypothetical protein n=1 Tax=Nostoc sp. TaxID=1180 RepID=UPI002FF50958
MVESTAIRWPTWRGRELVGISYLVAGLIMVLWTFGDRFISLPLLRRLGVEEPKFMLKLIATATRTHIPDGINGMVIPNSRVSQNSTSSR